MRACSTSPASPPMAAAGPEAARLIRLPSIDTSLVTPRLRLKIVPEINWDPVRIATPRFLSVADGAQGAQQSCDLVKVPPLRHMGRGSSPLLDRVERFQRQGSGEKFHGAHHTHHVPEDETFDIGEDTRTGVAMLEYRYDVPFKFTGKIDKLTFKLEPAQEAKP
jgi:hypothetical protein